ncbi:hypothetical protein [Helicobacter sp. T3_23-1056]
MIICGIDEAGRGCLAGSLFVAGVACKEAMLKNGLNQNLIKMGIKDSKKISKKTRYALESRLNEVAHLRAFVVEKTASEIDTKGLSACLKEALEEIIKSVVKQACDNDLCGEKVQEKRVQNPQNPQNLKTPQNPQFLENPQNQQILQKAQNLSAQKSQTPQNPPKNQNPQEIRFYFDGNSTFGASVANALRQANIAQPHDINATLECVIKGDEKIPLISCASIYAKCAKDTQSAKLAKIYPQYDFATNAGYGTKSHIDSIKKHGLSPAHRASFCVKFIDNGESKSRGDSRQFSYFAKSSNTKNLASQNLAIIKSSDTDSNNLDSKIIKPKQNLKSIKCAKNAGF